MIHAFGDFSSVLALLFAIFFEIVIPESVSFLRSHHERLSRPPPRRGECHTSIAETEVFGALQSSAI